MFILFIRVNHLDIAVLTRLACETDHDLNDATLVYSSISEPNFFLLDEEVINLQTFYDLSC